MKNGLNPKVHFSIVILIAILGFAFLVSRPKTVVKEDKTVANETSEKAKENNKHSFDPELEGKAKEIREKFAKDANPTNMYKALAEMFFQASAFDSSAVYYEKSAEFQPGLNSWLQAGDAYLQAYGMALDAGKMEQLAIKTREAYANALKFDASSLHAKTNTALTYVNTQNPMRAIGILREVLNENPKYTPAILSLGKLSMQSGQFDKAVERFNEVLQIDPENPDAKIGLAYSKIELNQLEEAKRLLNDLINSDIDPIVKDELKKTLSGLK